MVRTAPNQLANAAWTDGRVTWQIDQFCAFSLDPYSKWNTLGWWFPLGIRIIVPLWGPVILLRLWPSKYIVRICTVCVLYMYIYTHIILYQPLHTEGECLDEFKHFSTPKTSSRINSILSDYYWMSDENTHSGSRGCATSWTDANMYEQKILPMFIEGRNND